MMVEHPLFIIGIAVVAMLYAAVGHGGASGYLALLALINFPSKPSSVLALTMNLAVSAISFIGFQRTKFFRWELAWPFLVGSIPLAFIGGSLRIEGNIHKLILSGVLLLVAAILIWKAPEEREPAEPKRIWMVAVGAGIGLLSGIVGVGGGIFLSPVLILTGWANIKQTASVSALFIFANSLAGLAAKPDASFATVGAHWNLLVAGILGAAVGAFLGANRLSNPGLRRLLGFVLLFAFIKLVAR